MRANFKYRTRKATAEDMDKIYLMGLDAWGEGKDTSRYFEDCRRSEKYKKGEWFVLEDGEGQIISSLISYQLAPVFGSASLGIGSIATAPTHRRKGHAAALLGGVISHFHGRGGKRAFFLFADTQTSIYAMGGFVALPGNLQEREGSTLMVRCGEELLKQLQSDPEFSPPEYF